MNTIDVKTFDTNSNRTVRRLAVAIVGALVLGLAAVVTLGAAANVTGGGIFGRLGDYITAVGEALGNG